MKVANDPRVYSVVGGGKLWIDSLDQLNQRYGGFSQVREVPYGALQNMPDYPKDDTLIQEWGQSDVYVMTSSAKVLIPDASEVNRFYGGFARIQRVPVGSLARISDRPRPGTVFKERNTGKMALFDDKGVKIPWFPMPFVFPKIYIVPDGTLDRIP